MKLVLFNDFQLGVMTENGIVDVSDAVADGSRCGAQALMEDVITRWDHFRPKLEALLNSRDPLPLAGVRLRAPLPRPSKILCAAANYKEGIEVANKAAR